MSDSAQDRIFPTGISDIGVLVGWNDFAPNMFEVSIFGVDSTTGKTDVSIPEIRHYISRVEMNAPGLELERHALSKKWFVKSYKFADQISVAWKEDAALSVWRYHNDWIHNFYDRGNDAFISGPDRKKRTMMVSFQKFNSKSLYKRGLDSLVTTFKFFYRGLIPQSNYQLSADWEKPSGDSSKVTYTYFFDSFDYSVEDLTLRQLFKIKYEV